MTDTEIATVTKLIDLCRAKGVRLLEVGGCKLELGPAIDNTPTAKPGPDPELCRCTHPAHMHMNGLCTVGCSVEACAPPEATS